MESIREFLNTMCRTCFYLRPDPQNTETPQDTQDTQDTQVSQVNDDNNNEQTTKQVNQPS